MLVYRYNNFIKERTENHNCGLDLSSARLISTLRNVSIWLVLRASFDLWRCFLSPFLLQIYSNFLIDTQWCQCRFNLVL